MKLISLSFYKSSKLIIFRKMMRLGSFRNAKILSSHIEIIIILQKLAALACFQEAQTGKDKLSMTIKKNQFFQIKKIMIVSLQDIRLE